MQISLPRDFRNFPRVLSRVNHELRLETNVEAIFCFLLHLLACLVCMCLQLSVFKQVKDNSKKLVPGFYQGIQELNSWFASFVARTFSCRAIVFALGEPLLRQLL